MNATGKLLFASAALLCAVTAACSGEGFAYQTTYSFDTRLASALYSDKEAGAWVDKRKVDYQYDSDGHLVAVARHEMIAGNWQPTGSAQLEWTDNGHLARLVKLRTHGDLIGGEEWSFAYDTRGNLVYEEKQVRVDSKLEPTWVVAGTFENHYDSLDRLEERIGFAPAGDDEEPAEVLRVDYAHGAEDALEAEVDAFREAGAWIDDVRYTLSYRDGDLEAVVTHHRHEQAWVASNKFAFRFDALGMLVEITGWHRLATTSEWVEDEIYDYSYDANFDPSSVMDYVTEDGNRIEEQRVIYANEDGRAILPYNYARTRMHGLRSKNLMKFLFVQGI